MDLSGQIVDAGSTTLGINPAGYLLHSAIHGARPDLKCVVHFHTGPCAAVSNFSWKNAVEIVDFSSGATTNQSVYSSRVTVEISRYPRGRNLRFEYCVRLLFLGFVLLFSVDIGNSSP